MAQEQENVIRRQRTSSRLPDWAAGGAVLLAWLKGQGWLERIADRVQILRQGGYAGIDILVFLLFFFTSGVPGGIKGFGRRARPFRRLLGALGGRKMLATPSSVSRALDAVEVERVRAASLWLLLEVPETRALLTHPGAQLTDAFGDVLHVFHFDPTVTGVRHRSLPEGDDLPPAQRRSGEMTAPGHAGRKRSDAQFSRAALQHAGSGLWLNGWLKPGNAEPREDLEGALDTVVSTCNWLEHPLKRAVMCCDGQWVGVPALTAARARGVSLVTRCVRYECLDDPEVLRRLAEASWEYVEDSGPAPHRSTTELGLITLYPTKGSVHRDGTPYEPIEVRAVVSRFLQPGSLNHGRRIGEWQVELFAVDIAPEQVSAADAVTLYFSRFGQENRFAQEDREAELDRLLSHHLPGQELATIIGQFVWNLRICRGFEMDPPSCNATERKPRSRTVDSRPLFAHASPIELASEAPSPAELPLEACVPDTTPVPPVDAAPEETPVPESSVLAIQAASRQDLSVQRAKAETDLARALELLNWEHLLRNRPEWTWHADVGHVVCPNREHLVLCAVSEDAPLSARMSFRSAVGVCQHCPLANSCFPTARKGTYKNITVPLASEHATAVRAALHPVQQFRARDHYRLRAAAKPSPTPAPDPKIPRVEEAISKPEGGGAPRGSPPPRTRATLSVSAPEPTSPGPYPIQGHLFLPAAARHLFRTTCEDVTVEVILQTVCRRRPSRLLATSAADRQKRRLTWSERHARTALPSTTKIRLTLTTRHAPKALRRAVGSESPKAKVP